MEARSHATAPRRVRCCIVGGGPAGMMLGLLLARAGIETAVLEKHGEFLRDFRDDTIRPSTLQVMSQLGLLDEFLRRSHQRVIRITAEFGGHTLRIPDLNRPRNSACPFVAFMPQWDFLDFLLDRGRAYPNLTALMNTAPNAGSGTAR